MSGFDEILAELEQEEALPPDKLERLRAAADASPLRKERKEAVERARELEETNRVLTQRVAKDVFSQAGLKLDPSLLRTPDDLDVTDTDAVKKWALEQKLIEPEPPTDQAGIDAQARIAAAGVEGAAQPGQDDILAQLDPRAMTEDQFWDKAKALGRTT